MEKLLHECSILLGMEIDHSTHLSYTSAVNSYLTFCRVHELNMEPTPETLSFYATYITSFLEPRSVNTYLSGIANELETYFPDARKNCNSLLVTRTMKGAKHRYGKVINRKLPLSVEDLGVVCDDLRSSTNHDDLLFVAQLLVGFYALLRLAELCYSDKSALQDFTKITKRISIEWLADTFSFWLPTHKADSDFEGSRIIVQKATTSPDPYSHFIAYLHSRDLLFPLNPELWLRLNGQVPTRAWFIHRLRHYFPKEVAGQSLRSGGATNLALNGVHNDLIQAAGRWSSDVFRAYTRKNPFFVHALLFAGRTAHDHP